MMTWHDIRDPKDAELDRLAERYNLHPLHIEDCRQGNQNAKVEEQGDYLFVVKDNQPELKAAIAESFGDLPPPSETSGAPAVLPPNITRAQTLDKGHGRIETRQIMVSAEVVAHLGWPGAAQVGRI